MKPSEAPPEEVLSAERMFRRAPWRIGRRIFFICLVLALLGGIGSAINGYLAAEKAYRRDAGVLAETVARSVEQPLARAAAFGVPIDRLPDVERYLQGILEDAPVLARIEVRDAQNHAIFDAQDATRMATAFRVVRVPIRGRSGEVGSVLATASFNKATHPFLAASLPVLAWAAGLSLLTAVFAGVLVRQLVSRPALRAITALRRVRQGEIALRVAQDRAPEFADFWTAFRTRVRRTGDRWSALAGYAAELEASDYENRNQAAISDLVLSMREKYTLPYVMQQPSSSTSPDGST